MKYILQICSFILYFIGPKSLPTKTYPPEQNKFVEVHLDKRNTHRVPSFGHWNVQIQQKDPSLVKFNFTLPAGLTIGVYASRDSVPTHTKYDFMEILGGIGNPRFPRSPNDKGVNSEFTKFLDRGTWFISVFNDGSMSADVSLLINVADGANIPCPFDCHGHGVCVMGSCKCDPEFAGENCAYSKSHSIYGFKPFKNIKLILLIFYY